MAHSKAVLRQSLKQARLELTDAEHTLKSRAICERLEWAIDWSGVRSLHFFEPLHELMEVDISRFITDLEDQFPKLQMVAPRLIEGAWQMIGTHGGELPEQFDVIIVPMLGFDPKTLHRIGYGGGFYDKFLASQPQAKKVGVCFELGQVDHIEAESHDVSLDLIITESANIVP